MFDQNPSNQSNSRWNWVRSIAKSAWGHRAQAWRPLLILLVISVVVLGVAYLYIPFPIITHSSLSLHTLGIILIVVAACCASLMALCVIIFGITVKVIIPIVMRNRSTLMLGQPEEEAPNQDSKPASKKWWRLGDEAFWCIVYFAVSITTLLILIPWGTWLIKPGGGRLLLVAIGVWIVMMVRSARFRRFSAGAALIILAIAFITGNWRSPLSTTTANAVVGSPRRTDLTYNPYRFAKDANDEVIDLEKAFRRDPTAVKAIISEVPEGAWGKIIILPDSFNSGWCYQPSTEEDMKDPSWRVAFDFLNWNRASISTEGPFWWGERPYFAYHSMMFRLQGHIPHGILFQKGSPNLEGLCIP